MRRCNTSLLAALAVAVVGVGNLDADDSQSKDSAPSKEVVSRLSVAILKHCPEAKIEVTSSEFLAKHETMRFTIHGQDRNGEFTSKTYEEEGPNHKGFLLRVSVSRGRGGLPPGISKLSMSEPYFHRFFDAPATSDGKHYHLVKFYYGYHIDEKLKQAIKDAVPQGKVSRPSPR